MPRLPLHSPSPQVRTYSSSTTHLSRVLALAYPKIKMTAANELTELRGQLARLKRNFDETLLERQKLRDENRELSAKIDIFTRGSYFSGLLRNRFLSTFKRDKLRLPLSALEEEHISDGNAWVHEGNILFDCDLYTGRARHDYVVFERLYGMPPHAVPALIKDMATIALLNAHATVVASETKKCSPRFGEVFARFMSNLRAASYPEGYLRGKTEDPAILRLRQSYQACEAALTAEVTLVSQADP